ncbi:MAG: MFS family permease [Alphaproteobacteria bacterium]|jgi:MFS family permease
MVGITIATCRIHALMPIANHAKACAARRNNRGTISVIDAIRKRTVAKTSDRFFYGWVMVAVASLGIFASGPGQSHTFSVFIDPISRDLGISKATIATAYGLATLIAAFLLPQTGRLVDRFGARKSLIAIVILLGLCCMLFGAAANFLWLALAFALLRFFGQGSMMLGSANFVSQWFAKQRGFAMGLMALGFGISMAIHPPLGQYLIDTIGWRQAWVALGIMTWILMLPPLLLLAIDKPEDVGLRPDGEKQTAATDIADQETIVGLSLAEALRTPTFYIVSVSWFALAMLITSLHFWQVEVLTSQGISTEFAAQAFTISAISMVVAMPVVGRLFDRIRTRYVLALALLITATSLTMITVAHSSAFAIVYSVIFGINNAFSMTMFGYIWPRYFGRKHLGSIQGTGQMIGVVGASLGPLPIGWAFDAIGDATWTLRFLALLPVCAAIAVLLFLRTPNNVTGNEHLE